MTKEYTMQRRIIPLAAAAAAFSFALSACTGGASTQSGSSADGTAKASLTLGMTADIQGWDPSNQPQYQGWASEAVWDTLVRCDEFGKPVAAMAESWEVSDDNRTFTAHLRQGMTFSDGTAVDSGDVKSTFEFSKSNGGAQGDYAGITMDTPDDSTFSITWPDPQPQIIKRVCSPKMTSSELIDSGEVNDVPVGSGPYILDVDATTRGSVYTFTKNAEHWNAEAYPYEKLVLNVYDSETAALNALKTGQIDGTLVNAQTGPPPSFGPVAVRVVGFQLMGALPSVVDRCEVSER